MKEREAHPQSISDISAAKANQAVHLCRHPYLCFAQRKQTSSRGNRESGKGYIYVLGAADGWGRKEGRGPCTQREDESLRKELYPPPHKSFSLTGSVGAIASASSQPTASGRGTWSPETTILMLGSSQEPRETGRPRASTHSQAEAPRHPGANMETTVDVLIHPFI